MMMSRGGKAISLAVLFVTLLAAAAPPATVGADMPPTKTAKALAAPWLDRAAKEAAAIDDANAKLAILVSVAQACARAGDVEKFRAAVAVVEKTQRARGDTELNATEMCFYGGAVQLIPILVSTGRVDAAKKLLSEVPDGHGGAYKTQAAQTLAAALAEAGKIEEAQNLVKQAATNRAAVSIQYGIALGLARAAKIAEMTEALKSVEPRMHSSVYMSLITAQMKDGNLEGVKRTIQNLPEDLQSSAWSMIVGRQLKSSDFKGAKESLAMVKEPARADRLYLDLCFAQVQAGDLDGAAATAQGMAGQSQERKAYNLVAAAMVKKGDEAAARSLRDKISPALRERSDREFRQILVMSAAEAGDGKRAAAHLEAIPVKERNFSYYLAVAAAQRKSHDDAGYRKNIELAKAEADAPPQHGNRASWYRALVYRMAHSGDVDEAVKTARQLTDEKEQSQALAGVVNGCVQAGLLDRGWATIKLIPVASERAAAAAAAANHSVRKGETERLGEWIDALPGAHERAQACLSAGEAFISTRTLE